MSFNMLIPFCCLRQEKRIYYDYLIDIIYYLYYIINI